MFKFNDVFTDCTKYVTKLKTSEYKESGKNIIIDQGQNEIAGYTNNEEGLFEDIPALIFGDHTRCIKYINKPFYIGADGVKILKIKLEKANYKYWYYALKNINIPNTGYNRHFKWLKGLSFKKHTLIEQQKIVDKLDIISVLINQRQLQLKLLDDLIKARFVEMFGNPILNDKRWRMDKLKKITYKIGSGATPKGGKESYVEDGISLIRSMNVHDNRFIYNELAHITDVQASQLKNVIVNENDVLFNITGASITRTCIVPLDVLPARVNQHVCIIRPDKNINAIFLCHLLQSNVLKSQLIDIGESNGATRQAITKQQLEQLMIICPPIELQNQFADFVKEVDKSKFEVKKSLEKTQQLYESLMQKYFGQRDEEEI